MMAPFAAIVAEGSARAGRVVESKTPAKNDQRLTATGDTTKSAAHPMAKLTSGMAGADHLSAALAGVC